MNEIINAPAIFTSRHGLRESANLVEDSGGRWENGVQFTPLGCYTLGATETACPPEEKDPLQECVAVATFKPYVLTLGLDWNQVQGAPDPKDLARGHLDVGTSSKLEDLIWNGVAGGTNPTLLTATSVTPASASALAAIGAVEAAILDSEAATGGGGTLYMSPLIAVHAQAVLENGDAQPLRTTTTGAKVVVGNFGTDRVVGHAGDVDLYLGDIFITDTNDAYRSNEYAVMAERLAVAVWNPCAVFFSLTA